jgi:hypothetical protein
MVELRPFERGEFARLIGWVKSPEFLLQWAGPAIAFPLPAMNTGVSTR